jgi:Domain of unknown function (DUF4160)
MWRNFNYLCLERKNMSPTILIIGKYRFFFNSREELRRHIHVTTSDGTVKIWLEPVIGLADFYNISSKELTEIIKIVEDNKDEFIEKWNRHFSL